MIVKVFVIFILLAHFDCVKAEFWLTATVEKLDFNPNCIENARCEIAQSSFKLSHRLPSLKESKSSHFPVMQLHEKLTLVSHWEFGNADELETELSIVKTIGTKPAMIWFCDESQEIVLIEERIETKSAYALIQVKGRCFNSTISLQKHHTHACPWCAESPASVALTSDSPLHLLIAAKMQDPYVFWPMVVATVLTFTIIALLLFVLVQACSRSKIMYSVSSTPTSSKGPLFVSSPTDSNPSYVNTEAFMKKPERLPYFIRPQYLYSEQRYGQVNENYQTPRNNRRKLDPESPETIIRTPSPSIIFDEV